MQIKKNKILIATGIFPPDIGGPATMLDALARGLLDNGFSVSIITYSDKPEIAEDENKSYRIIRISRQGKLKHLFYFITLLLYSLKADLIYATDTYSVGYFVYLLKMIFKKKYILRFTGDSAWETAVNEGLTLDPLDEFVSKKYSPRIEQLKAKRKKILLNADKVITASDSLSNVAETIGVDHLYIVRIYNSVDFMDFGSSEPADLEGDPVILTIGRLIKIKGFDGIIRVIGKLKNLYFKKIKLYIIGDGIEKSRLKEIIIEQGLEDNVTLTGKLKPEQIISYFKSADLLLLNSNYEGFPHVVLEAMSAGVPVVASAVGGTKEIIKNTENGLLFNFKNEDEIVAAARSLLENKDLQIKLVNQAKIDLKKFNWSDNLNITINAINQVIDYE